MAEALYRKYRPQVFSDVVGQDHIERTIKNALEANQVSHAYLFCGPRGTGKTTTARLLAKALLCEKGPTPEPDGTCEECVQIAEGTHPDVYELDAASRTGVENVRDEIIGRVNFAPTRGKSKVYIIDEVHMLSMAAFNALLKTLEEPPEHVVFILCTTDPQKVPETIHSRCQRFDFHRLSNDEIVSHLGAVCVAEGVEFEGDALDLIAHRAEGGMRNALTSLEQLIAFGEGKVSVQGAEDLLGSLGVTDMAEIVRAVGQRDVAACFNWTAGYVGSGADLAQFARDMADHVRNLYVLSLAGTDAALEIPEAERRQLTEELAMFKPDRLARLLGVLGDLISDLRTATNPRLCFEIALTRMVRPDADLTLEALAERIERLELGSAVLTNSGQVDAAASAGTQSAFVSGSSPTEVGFAPINETISGTSETLADSSTTSDSLAQPVGNSGSEEHIPTAPASELQPSRNGVQTDAAPFPDAASSVGANLVEPIGDANARAANLAEPVALTDSSTTYNSIAQPAGNPGSEEGVPTAPASSDSLAALLANPPALQRVWQSVVSTVKKEKVSYGVLLVNVKAKPAPDGQSVAIEFPADNPFALSMAKKPEVQSLLTQAFQQAAGFPVPFSISSAVLPNGGQADAAASAGTQSAFVSGSSPTEVGFAPINETISGTSETLAELGSAVLPNGGQADAAPFPDAASSVGANLAEPVALADSSTTSDSPAQPVGVPFEPDTPGTTIPAVQAPLDDQVPLDVYDASTPVSVSTSEPTAVSTPAPEPASVTLTPAPEPASTPDPATTPDSGDSADNVLEADDLGKMLTDVMGVPVKVEELDE